jgi:hypothetical protein
MNWIFSRYFKALRMFTTIVALYREELIAIETS